MSNPKVFFAPRCFLMFFFGVVLKPQCACEESFTYPVVPSVPWLRTWPSVAPLPAASWWSCALMWLQRLLRTSAACALARRARASLASLFISREVLSIVWSRISCARLAIMHAPCLHHSCEFEVFAFWKFSRVPCWLIKCLNRTCLIPCAFCTGRRLHGRQRHWRRIHLWCQVCRWELHPQALRTWNFVHGQRRTQHKWISILPLYREDSVVGWQACGVWRCDRRHGCCEEDWGCRLSVWQDRQAGGRCRLRPIGIGEDHAIVLGRILTLENFQLESSFEHILRYLRTSDKCCAYYEAPRVAEILAAA